MRCSTPHAATVAMGARVLARHGLGRFRVTQKARLDDPHDPYRADLARPEDWVMVGTHDTPPLWTVVDRWRREGALAARAAYLAERLAPPGADRAAFAARLAAAPGLLVHAELAALCRGVLHLRFRALGVVQPPRYDL